MPDREQLIWKAWSAVNAADNRQERAMGVLDCIQEFMAIPDDTEHAELKRLAVFMRWADAHCEKSVEVAVDAVLPLIEADLREQLAGEMMTATLPRGIWDRPSIKGWFIQGVEFAAKIVRGASADTDPAPTPTGEETE